MQRVKNVKPHPSVENYKNRFEIKQGDKLKVGQKAVGK